MTTEPKAFETIEDLESWLSRNHDTESELIVRLYKVQSGIPSITWDELVQGILCWGWIEGSSGPMTRSATRNGSRRANRARHGRNATWRMSDV